MQLIDHDPQLKNVNPNEQYIYETPAIIYEGMITTRAGSALPGGEGGDAVDPADLFGND